MTDSTPSSGLGFPDALRAVLDGHHITRDRWADGRYVTAQAGYPDGIGINANTAAATGLPEDTEAVFRPYLMKCQGTVQAEGDPGRRLAEDWVRPHFVPWTPNQGDLFARDWQVLVRPAGQG